MFTNLPCLNTASRLGLGSGTASFIWNVLLQAAVVELLSGIPSKIQNIWLIFIQCWTNIEDVGPALCKCYANVLC